MNASYSLYKENERNSSPSQTYFSYSLSVFMVLLVGFFNPNLGFLGVRFWEVKLPPPVLNSLELYYKL